MPQNTKFDKDKQKYIEENELNINRIYLSDQENAEMSQVYLKSNNDEKKELLKEHDLFYDPSIEKYPFYKKESCEIDENMLTQHMLLNMLEKIDETNSKINVVKNIAVFFLIIVGLIILLYIIAMIS